METNQQESPESIQQVPILQVTPESVSYLATTAKWTKFLSVLGFVFSGFLLLAGVVLTVFFGSVGSQLESSKLPFINSGFIGVIYLVIALIYIWPVIYLNNFSNYATRAVKSGNTEILTRALLNLKRLFKFMGILMIIMLVVYLIAIVAIIVAGSMLM
jgi:uncharacterized membrane protein